MGLRREFRDEGARVSVRTGEAPVRRENPWKAYEPCFSKTISAFLAACFSLR
jgi:hypothetical protein